MKVQQVGTMGQIITLLTLGGSIDLCWSAWQWFKKEEHRGSFVTVFCHIDKVAIRQVAIPLCWLPVLSGSSTVEIIMTWPSVRFTSPILELLHTCEGNFRERELGKRRDYAFRNTVWREEQRVHSSDSNQWTCHACLKMSGLVTCFMLLGTLDLCIMRRNPPCALSALRCP
jgi:hypothetical protein